MRRIHRPRQEHANRRGSPIWQVLDHRPCVRTGMILQGYCVCVIDPEGDYTELEALPGVAVLGGNPQPPDIPDVARAFRHFDLSVIIDLSRLRYEAKLSYIKAVLPMLAFLRRTTGLPHRIVVDEAHYFLHDPNVRQLLDLELGAYTVVTYRPSDLHPDFRKDIEVVIAKRTTHLREVQTRFDSRNSEGWTRMDRCSWNARYQRSCSVAWD